MIKNNEDSSDENDLNEDDLNSFSVAFNFR